MSNAVATVSALQGQAWAKAPDGSLRLLAVGSVLSDDETLVTAQGARVELDVGTSELLVVNGGMEVGMTRDLMVETATQSDEAMLSDASVQEALTILEQGGDLLDGMEETAAGNSGGEAGEGHGFVRLTRIVEETDSLSFSYDSSSATTNTDVLDDARSSNQTPLVTDQIVFGNEDEPVSGAIIATDIEGDELTYTLATPPIHGALTLNPVTGQFTFIPDANYNGADSFIVTVTDAAGNSTNTNITLNITPVNDAPTSADVALTTNEDQAANGQIVASDVDGDTLAYAVSGNPTNGTVTLNAATGSFVYTPNTNYNGSDTFVVTISDGKGGTTTSTVSIGVTPVNDAPVSINQTLTTDEDVALPGQIVASDVDGDTLAYAVSGNPTNGTVTLNAATGSFVYTPNANYNGSDTFVVTISDGKGGTTTSTVSIGVTPVNDAPVSADLALTTIEDQATNGQIVASDVDGDTLAYAVSGNPTNGTVVVNAATGSFVYTPNANYNGSDTFVVTISDGKGGTTTSTVSIGVTPVNDAPITVADNITVAEGGTVTVLVGGATSVLTNDTDGDSDPLTAILVAGPTNGTLTLNANGTFSYTHNGGETTSDSFTYKTNDGTADGNTVTVTIGVTPVNDAPIANNDTATLDQDTAVAVAVRDNDTDAEGDSLTVTGVTQGTNGSVVIDVISGNPIYTPNAGFSGSDSFSYTVNDGHGGTATATVNVTVNAVIPANQAPETTAVAVTGNEDELVTINLSGSDTDGTVAGFFIKSLPANGVLYSDALMATPVVLGDLVVSPVYFMPNANWNGSTNLTYAAQDNLGLEDATPATVTITIDPVADSAILGSGTGAVKEDTPAKSNATGQLSIFDPDAGQAAFQIQTNAPGTYGTFSVDATGSWSYVIDNSKSAVQVLKEGEIKTETFTVASIDGTTTTVVITVTGTNDGPTAVADMGTTLRNTALTFTPAELLGNDTDPDGDTLSIQSVQGGVNGNAVLVDGNVVFTPTAGYFGAASFTYTVSDGHGGTSTATVAVDVQKPNTAPVANSDSVAPFNTGLLSEYFGYREGPDGANLGTIAQVNAFISGRTADATFIAKTFDYGASATFSNNLGTDTNLQAFLGSDAASLNVDPATTSDAIIRMQGLVALDAGSYRFKVTADDGYQIKVDGVVVVAEINQNQSATTTTHVAFNVAAAGLHTIEIVYWDQGGRARLKLELSSDGGTTYYPLANAPTYQHGAFVTLEDKPLAIPVSSLLANDTDADGDTLSVISVQDATHGTVNLVGGNIVFTPTENYNGAASFSYTISDGKGGAATATVNLTVAPVNDAPIAVNDSVVIATNAARTIDPATLLANDTDIDSSIKTMVSVQNAVNGTVVLSNGKVIFTPTTNFEGTGSFTYTIRDDFGATSTASVNVVIGSANAPSIVVAKSLVALAHGTGGTSVKFPIITQLVDTDGSESLSIKVSGVPAGASFNAGTNLGGGIWAFVEADLPNLMLNLPGSFTTEGTNLTVAVTSTEENGGMTATTSTVARLKAAYTTVDVTTTESGNYTGSSANEHIQGGNGDNVIDGKNGNNIVYGGAGNDTITTGTGSDIIFGGSGNDTINSGGGTDRISGGAGNDRLNSGGADNMVDVFVWSLGDQGTAGTPAVDTIEGFATAAAGTSASGGDVLDLRDLLVGEHVGANNSAGNLADYLHFEVAGGSTTIHISHTGGFNADSHAVGAGYTSSAETQKIVLSGVDLQAYYSGATTDQQIITQLLNNNKLITD